MDFESRAIPGMSPDSSYAFTGKICQVCGKPTAGHSRKWGRPPLCLTHSQAPRMQTAPPAPGSSALEVTTAIQRENDAKRVAEDKKNGVMYWKDGKPWP